MIWKLYSSFNKKIGCYSRPLVLQDDEEEYIERIKRDFLASPEKDRSGLAEYTVFYLGTYDDNTNKFDLVEPNCIFDIGCLLGAGEVNA